MALLFFGLLFLVAVIFIDMLPLLGGNSELFDFGSFYASGLNLSNGENPYSPDSGYIFSIYFSKVGAGGKMVNLNPPIFAMLFGAFIKYDPHELFYVWRIISAFIYSISILILARFYKKNLTPIRIIWAFMLAGFWHTLELGQIYTLLLLFTSLGWIFLLREKYILAGLAIGLLVAIKPNFLIWPLFLLFSGYVACFLSSIATGVLLSIIPMFFHGSGIYMQWLEASALQHATLIMPGNNSLLGLASRFNYQSLGVILSFLVILVLLLLSRRQAPQPLNRVEYVSTLGIIASLLASPIAWTGYTILLIPIFFSLPRWNLPVIVSAIILTVPFPIVLQFFQTSSFNFVLFGWLYGWAILSLLAAVIANTMMTRSIQTN